jgi:hypothetical protein
MSPKQIALAIIIALALWATSLLTGCVSIPIPPGGQNPGQFGRLELKLVFTPNISGAIDYLWSQQQPKPTSSK